jgi:hypothetical protein
MFTRLTLCSSLAAVSIMAASGPALSDGLSLGRAKPSAPLVGTWQVRLTPYNCATLEEFPQAAFNSFMTFGEGGTMLETTSNPSFLAGQRSPGHGYWERTDRDSYHAIFRAFVQFTTPNPVPPTVPYQRGVQTVDQGIEMQGDDQWTSDALVTFRDVNGNIVAPPVVPPGVAAKPGCARVSAQRME